MHDAKLDHLYRDWFLDYASYVILDRAIPNIEDGLKPVQRRLLHALQELDDGRLNKAANVIGHTMRYHPHGDMAISEALVKLAQKSLLIETQGNWGNVQTGDRAAAPRYIEARLTSFAKEVVFNSETTAWQPSYDGRNQEPISLPVKFPLLLAQGAEGIAVGLATKILPHNFCELIRESIAILKGFKPQLVPDFPSGGIADFSAYKMGRRGGKVRLRAVIEVLNPKTLQIREIPYGTTTTSVIESILAALEKGQIKIKKIEDNTAQEIDIVIHLPNGAATETVIQALYAFTECEISIAPNCCVINNGKPDFCGVDTLLQFTTEKTKKLLEQELENAAQKWIEKIHLAELEQIFIEEKIYRKIENCTDWQDVITKISTSLKPFKAKFIKTISDSDIEKLTEIKIKRITKYDREQAEKNLSAWRDELATVKKNLKNLTTYTISYYQSLLKKYGKGQERRTKIATFDKINAAEVVLSDLKLYVNRKEGFIGTSLKKDEFVCDCSALDEVIAFCRDGSFQVSKVSDKAFFGKDILWLGLFKRNDDRCTYHIIYRDGKSASTFAKRFTVLSATRDKTYSLTKGTPGSELLYFSVNPQGETEKVRLSLRPSSRLKNPALYFDFSTLPVQNRTAVGTNVSKQAVAEVALFDKGSSAQTVQRLWFERDRASLNANGHGIYLGKFAPTDKLIVVYQAGFYEICPCDPGLQFADEILEIQKWEDRMVLSAIYYDAERKETLVKRVAVTEDRLGRWNFIPRSKGSRLLLATLKAQPVIKAEFEQNSKTGATKQQIMRLDEFIDAKGIKALEEKLSSLPVKSVKIVREDD